MPQEKIRKPAKGGLDEARRKLKEMRKKDPSPTLIKIIEEVTHRDSGKNGKQILPLNLTTSAWIFKAHGSGFSFFIN